MVTANMVQTCHKVLGTVRLVNLGVAETKKRKRLSSSGHPVRFCWSEELIWIASLAATLAEESSLSSVSCLSLVCYLRKFKKDILKTDDNCWCNNSKHIVIVTRARLSWWNQQRCHLCRVPENWELYNFPIGHMQWNTLEGQRSDSQTMSMYPDPTTTESGVGTL